MNKNTTFTIHKWAVMSILLCLLAIALIVKLQEFENKIDSQGLTPSSPGIYTSIDPLHPNRTIIVLDTGDARQKLLALEAANVLQQWGINPALNQLKVGIE